MFFFYLFLCVHLVEFISKVADGGSIRRPAYFNMYFNKAPLKLRIHIFSRLFRFISFVKTDQITQEENRESLLKKEGQHSLICGHVFLTTDSPAWWIQNSRIENRGDSGEKASVVLFYQLAFLLKIYVVCFVLFCFFFLFSTRKSGQK